MIEFTAEHFDELCSADPVRERLGAIEADRRAALRKFWIRLPIALVLAVGSFVSLFSAGWAFFAIIFGGLFLIGGIVYAYAPIGAAQEGLKHPVLETLAARGELEFIPNGFEPPAYAAARNLLFGTGLSSQSFTDLFHGKDAEGHGHAVYEACLQKRAGKNTTTVFTGQMYGLQRRPRGPKATTVIVPDRKIFNFFKPGRDLQRVKIEGDEEFERRFEVYSTDMLQAKQMLFDTDLRRLLLDLRKQGAVYLYAGPDEALVATAGKDRFEPGSLFSARAGEERVKRMFDDVCASLATLRRLKAKLS